MTDATMAPLDAKLEPMTPEELRQRRLQLDLSQAELAALTNPPTTQHTISRWEEGKIKLTAPRSLWLDVEMKRIERERRRKQKPTPKRKGRRTTARREGDARTRSDGGREDARDA